MIVFEEFSQNHIYLKQFYFYVGESGVIFLGRNIIQTLNIAHRHLDLLCHIRLNIVVKKDYNLGSKAILGHTRFFF